MEIRFKFWVRLAMVAIALGGLYAVIEKFKHDEDGIKELVFIILYPLAFYVAVFLGPTLRVMFSSTGIKATWKVGAGAMNIWEQKNYRLRWEDLTAVYSVFPLWIPLHMIGVAGYQHDLDKARNFFIGFATTKKKESLLYIADHVSPEIISDEVQNLVEKYRTQKERKQNACAK